MDPIVIAFAGQIGSGKSSLSRRVAKQLGCRRVAFGDYIRTVARSKGLNVNDRKVLQDLGLSLVQEGVEKFCRSVLFQMGWDRDNPLVIDGVRHVGVLEAIERIAHPVKVYLVYIATDAGVRKLRLAKKGMKAEEFARAEAHEVEKESGVQLKTRANLVLDGTTPEQELLERIFGTLRRLDPTL